MVDGAALEKRWAAMSRGFESHPLRRTGSHAIWFICLTNATRSNTLICGCLLGNKRIALYWRGAGVADQARLESACRF